MLAYSDESGSPGTALHSNDWFLVAIIFFKDKTTKDQAKKRVTSLRKKLNLSQKYEFHHVKDSKIIQKEFYKTIASMDFTYKAFIIKKTSDKKFCSETAIAKYIIEDFKNIEKTAVIIDRNPKLYVKLCKAKKIYSVKDVSFKESDSSKEDLLQVVDYVASYEMMKVKKKKVIKSASLRRLEKKKTSTKFYIKNF